MSKGRIHDRRYPSQAFPSASELAPALKGHRVSEGRYMAVCPYHDESTPSLSIIDGRNGRAVVFALAVALGKRCSTPSQPRGSGLTSSVRFRSGGRDDELLARRIRRGERPAGRVPGSARGHEEATRNGPRLVIPYCAESGVETVTRYRGALSGKDADAFRKRFNTMLQEAELAAETAVPDGEEEDEASFSMTENGLFLKDASGHCLHVSQPFKVLGCCRSERTRAAGKRTGACSSAFAIATATSARRSSVFGACTAISALCAAISAIWALTLRATTGRVSCSASIYRASMPRRASPWCSALAGT